MAISHPFETDARSITRTALDDERLLSGPYWSELRTFLALAKTGSLTRAAQSLGVSHTTVGRDIRRLQDVLGSQLVVIRNSGAVLTERGTVLARELARVDRDLHVLTRDLNLEARRAEGTVRVSVTDGLGVVFLAPALRKLARDYPGIQVHVKTPVNFRNFAENQTDCMLGFSAEDSPEITARRRGWLHFLPMCSRTYLDRRGLPGRDNLQNHEFVDSEQYSGRGGAWRSWQGAVARGRVSYLSDASITYAMMVKAGLGIGLLGNYNVLEPAAVPLDLDVRISLPLYAVALTERLQAKPVRVVFDFLCDVFGPKVHWFTKEMRLDAPDAAQTEGYSMLFNL